MLLENRRAVGTAPCSRERTFLPGVGSPLAFGPRESWGRPSRCQPALFAITRRSVPAIPGGPCRKNDGARLARIKRWGISARGLRTTLSRCPADTQLYTTGRHGSDL